MKYAITIDQLKPLQSLASRQNMVSVKDITDALKKCNIDLDKVTTITELGNSNDITIEKYIDGNYSIVYKMFIDKQYKIFKIFLDPHIEILVKQLEVVSKNENIKVYLPDYDNIGELSILSNNSVHLCTLDYTIGTFYKKVQFESIRNKDGQNEDTYKKIIHYFNLILKMLCDFEKNQYYINDFKYENIILYIEQENVALKIIDIDSNTFVNLNDYDKIDTITSFPPMCNPFTYRNNNIQCKINLLTRYTKALCVILYEICDIPIKKIMHGGMKHEPSIINEEKTEYDNVFKMINELEDVYTTYNNYQTKHNDEIKQAKNKIDDKYKNIIDEEYTQIRKKIISNIIKEYKIDTLKIDISNDIMNKKYENMINILLKILDQMKNDFNNLKENMTIQNEIIYNIKIELIDSVLILLYMYHIKFNILIYYAKQKSSIAGNVIDWINDFIKIILNPNENKERLSSLILN